MSDNMKVVKFIKWHGCYNAGNIAGFPTSTADWLIKHGKAVAYEPDASSDSVAKEPPKRANATEKMVKKGYR